VSLPFFFLFSLPSFYCCQLFSLLWSSGSRRFRSLLPMAGHLRVPTAPFSHRYLPQRCLQPNLVQVSPIDRLAFYFPVLTLFPVVFCILFCSSLFVVLVFPCIVLSLLVLCVFYFCSSADLLCVRFAALHLLPNFILRTPPPRDELQTHLLVFGVCLNPISFSLYFLFACICFSLYFYCVFTCNNALASLIWLDPL
jgi:hypothetical protein